MCCIAAENTCVSGTIGPVNSFHMNVEDTVAEPGDELNISNPLIGQVTGVEVESEGRMVSYSFQSSFSRCNIEGDFGGVDFQGKPDAQFLELVRYRLPQFTDFFQSEIYHRGRGSREGIY